MGKFVVLMIAVAASGAGGDRLAPPRDASLNHHSSPLVVQSRPATSGQPVDAPAEPLTGKVTGQVKSRGQDGSTLVVTIQGRAVTFAAGKLNDVPRVGESIEVTFTLDPKQPDALPVAVAAVSARTDPASMQMFMGGASRAPAKCVGGPVGGGNCHCHKSYYGPFQSLNVCSG